jgi:DNA-directed RNA polymerase specialized sigma24 family protein
MDIGKFNAVFLEHERAIRDIIHKIISDADVENDILQELYCQLVDKGTWVDVIRHANPQALLKRMTKQRTIAMYRKRKRAIPFSALLTEDTTEEGISQRLAALRSEWQYSTADESAVEQETEKDAPGTRQRRKKPGSAPFRGASISKRGWRPSGYYGKTRKTYDPRTNG